MCKIDTPKPQKAPPPAKLGLEEPILDDKEVTEEDDGRKKKATGLDQLRIDLSAPALTAGRGGAGIQR